MDGAPVAHKDDPGMEMPRFRWARVLHPAEAAVAKQNAPQAQNVPTTSFGTIFVSMLRNWQTLVKDADLPKQITPTSELWETDCKVAHGSGWHATCALHTPTDVTTRVLVEAGWPNDT